MDHHNVASPPVHRPAARKQATRLRRGCTSRHEPHRSQPRTAHKRSPDAGEDALRRIETHWDAWQYGARDGGRDQGSGPDGTNTQSESPLVSAARLQGWGVRQRRASRACRAGQAYEGGAAGGHAAGPEPGARLAARNSRRMPARRLRQRACKTRGAARPHRKRAVPRGGGPSCGVWLNDGAVTPFCGCHEGHGALQTMNPTRTSLKTSGAWRQVFQWSRSTTW